MSRRLPAILANKLISVATGVTLHDYGISLKVFRAEVVKPLKLYGEKHGGGEAEDRHRGPMRLQRAGPRMAY